MWKKISLKKLTPVFLCLFFGLGAICLLTARAQTNSIDAIAIRVFPNLQHYSAQYWYEDQGFSGSPQSLTVDGYEAVRDGRTVYVNVANIVGATLYTNVYLISYNQEAESVTVDIFGHILSHWKFNSNLNTSSQCRGDSSIFCLSDDDCSIGDVCNSDKARVTRDTRRLSDISRITAVADEFKSKYGKYPTLDAGTYIKNYSISVWPSWQETLANDLGAGNLPLDPVNKIGDCPGYNETTCWDEVNKRFAATLPDLPNQSLAYVYEYDSANASMQICGVFESGYTIGGAAVCILNVCLDFDGDGCGRPVSPACTSSVLDCDDNNNAVCAGSPENCSDGIDNDCDGLTDCNDGDCSADPSCSSAFCVPTACDAYCPFGCTVSEDPDCGCLTGNACCGLYCSYSSDNDCPLACTTSGSCDAICPSGCTLTDDPDCGCSLLSANSCCPSACDISLDIDCPEICTNADGDAFNAIDAVYCPSGTDCDDTPVTGASIYPGATEQCNGADDDCDTFVDEAFGIEDCWWVCQNPPTGNANYNYSSILPGRTGNLRCCGNNAYEANGGLDYQLQEDAPTDYCSDGQDNDCDGYCDTVNDACWAGSIADPDCAGCFGTFVNESLWYIVGQDCDQCDYNGDQDGDQSPGSWSLYPGMADLCDNDCTGYGAQVSVAVQFDDYQLIETRCDGIDNDCDGNIDEDCDDDGDGYCDDSMILWNNNNACPNTPFAADGDPGDDCNDTPVSGAGINPGVTEICGNGIDENCDLVDDPCPPTCTDADLDFYIAESTNLSFCGPVCGPGNNQACIGNNDCDDALSWIYPGATETCDTYDNNCVNGIDEGCDDDSDGYCDSAMQIYNNTSMCTNTTFTFDGMFGDDCDDSDININLGAAEVCDGIDNNCMNGVDEGFTDETCQTTCEASGFSWTGNGGTLNCCGNDPAPEGSPVEIPEISCDSNDNDCDGTVDEGCVTCCTFTFFFDCTFCTALPSPPLPPSLP